MAMLLDRSWVDRAERRYAGLLERAGVEPVTSTLRRFAFALYRADIEDPEQAVGRFLGDFPHRPLDIAVGTMEPHPHAAVHARAHSPELADAVRAVERQRLAAQDAG